MGIRKARSWKLLAVLIAIPSIALAGDGGGESATPSISPGPWISTRVPTPVQERVETAFDLARQRLSEVESCRALFSDLGADGLEMLASTLYYPADQRLEKQTCRGAWAFTTVGAAPTYLCRKFSKISDQRGALILIHEALHHAGLGEYPQDPDALTSGEINAIVADACEL